MGEIVAAAMPARLADFVMPLQVALGTVRVNFLITPVALMALSDAGTPPAVIAHSPAARRAAMYIGGAYGAYHGTEISDAAFASLVTQLRDALAATASFTSASMPRKQDMYEALAISGTAMVASVQMGQRTDAVRLSGKAALENILHTGADSIRIDDRGIRLADRSAALDARAPTPPPLASSPAPAQDAAPAGKPFPSSSVAALLWSFELRYQAFPENSMVHVESDYLLLTDGTCIDGIPRTLDGFDPAKARAAHPKRSCRWRKDKGSYTVATGGSFRTLPNLTVLRGARRGERLAGTWTRSKTGTVGTATTWKGTTLVLDAGGRFDFASAGAWQSGSELTRRDGEVVISGVYDPSGSHTTISGDHAGGSIQTRTGSTAADQSGTYVLDGYSIELRYDRGKVERHLFAISTDSGHVFVRLDGTMMPKK